MNERIEYVNGFLIDDYNNRVALIRKNKPAFQKDKLNGIGGKIEPGETPKQAMIREFKEETGKYVTDWQLFMTLDVTQDNYKVHFYVSHFNGGGWENLELKQMTEEHVDWYDIDEVRNMNTLRNVKWILPMALNCNSHVYEITTES